YSIKYGTFSEFHREYYITNKAILKKLPNYFISFLVQFSAITYTETNFFKKNILNLQRVRIENANKLSNLILKSIFSNHKIYNGSMFSEFEFIGHSNYLLKKKPQRPILTLRFGLNGKLTNLQINICKILNFKHLTYEHSHPNKFSKGMLLRNQTWGVYFRVIFKSLFKHYLRLPRHYLRYIHYLKSSYGKS
ncbi:hypothetical protein N9S67_02770, partial [Candidatus Pelagibacter sp.]|nr:hypothetical protein [Candidatus Pelagibacter sp.]